MYYDNTSVSHVELSEISLIHPEEEAKLPRKQPRSKRTLQPSSISEEEKEQSGVDYGNEQILQERSMAINDSDSEISVNSSSDSLGQQLEHVNNNNSINY